MPDSSHQRERANDIAHNAPALPPPSTIKAGRRRGERRKSEGRKGGVFLARNGKSYTINVRPRGWVSNANKFWKGQIKSLEVAKYIADAVLHYCGRPRFHFKKAELSFPPLKIGTSECLTSTEECSNYARSIVGDDFLPQRKDFIKAIKAVIKSASFSNQSDKFLNHSSRMQEAEEETAPALPDAARPREEAASLPKEDAPASPPVDDNDDGAGRETPMEEDHVSLDMVREFAPSQPTVAGFELNPERFNAGVSGKSLHSVEESLGSKYLVDDCPNGHDEDGTRITKLMRDGTPAMAVPSAKTPRSISANQTYIPTDILIDTSHVAQRRPEICFIDHSYIDSVAAP